MKPLHVVFLSLLMATRVALAIAPTVSANSTTVVKANFANVTCTIDMKGLVGQVVFLYGTTSGALDQTTAPPRRVAANATSTSARLAPLLPNTKYFFQAKATNADGSGVGPETSFTTGSLGGGGGTTVTAKVVAVVGQPVTGEDPAVVYASLKLAEGPFSGTMKVGRAKVPAIFAADGSVQVKVGGEAPSLVGSVITKLGDPSGGAALATLKANAGGVTAQDNGVLLAGLGSTPRIAARTGKDLSNATGVQIKKFGAIDGNGTVVFFVATLEGNVTRTTNLGLCAALADGSVRVIARTGQTVGESIVKSFGTLVGTAGTLSEGRWRVADDQFGVRITDDDDVQRLYYISSTSVDAQDWTSTTGTDDLLSAPAAGAVVKTLGIPGFGSVGPSLPVNLYLNVGGVDKTKDAAVIRATSSAVTVVAQEGGAVPDESGTVITGLSFATFGSPVAGVGGLTAFAATVKGAPKNAKSGLWRGTSTADLKLLARAGDDAPDVGKFASFTTLALPDGATSGPLFTGKLVTDRTANIDKTNNTGLWGVNSTGALIGLLRTGDQIDNVAGAKRTVKSFVTLTSGVGSIGAAHSYDATHVSALVTFKDRFVALVELTIP